MKTPLLNEKCNINTLVRYATYDSDNKKVLNYADKNYSCFSAIWNCALDKKTDKMIIFRPANEIPYPPEIIKKWIDELNNLGFPCYVEIEVGTSPNMLENQFILKMADFKGKLHFLVTLTLIRCLFETYICNVPGIYFGYLKTGELNPDEKFEALQKSHKLAKEFPELVSMNCGHAIVPYGGITKPNVTLEEFWDNLKKDTLGIYGQHKNSVHFCFTKLPK